MCIRYHGFGELWTEVLKLCFVEEVLPYIQGASLENVIQTLTYQEEVSIPCRNIRTKIHSMVETYGTINLSPEVVYEMILEEIDKM